MRFELIDRVVEIREDGLTAVKNVSLAEEYLQDHFPSFPVLPGVLMLETMVQAARRFVAETMPEQTEPLMIQDVRNLRYGNMVRPGEALEVRVTLRSHEEGVFSFEGRGTVNEQIAVQGRFTLVPVSHLDKPVVAEASACEAEAH